MISFSSFIDEMKKISAVDPEEIKNIRRQGEYYNRLGKKLMPIGYGGGALALGASFLPGIRNRALARRLLRVGALGGGLLGYTGELAPRSGRGYLTAADVAEGKQKALSDFGPDISPAAYREAHGYLTRRKSATGQ